MLHSLGSLAVRRARLILVAAALTLVAAGVIGAGAFAQLKTEGFDDPNADSTKAAALVEERFGGEADLILLVRPEKGTVDDPAAVAAGIALAEKAAADPDLSNVVSYWQTKSPALKSPDGEYALVLAHAGDNEEVIERYTSDGPDITVAAGGEAGVSADVGAEVGKSLGIAEAIAVPITLLLLVVAFRGLVAGLLPLAIGLISIMGTFAELAILGRLTDVAIYAINLTTALGLALAVDYALLMVSRFREELAGGASTERAVVRSVQTAGRTILFSATTVVAALSVLLLFPLYFLRSFAYAGIGVVIISCVAALVVLPALLAVLGPRVNKGRLPWFRGEQAAASTTWARIGSFAMRRPVIVAVPAIAALLALAAPLLHVEFGTPDDRVLHTSVSSRQVGDVLREEFDNSTTGIEVVADGAMSGAEVSAYAAGLSQLGDVERVESSAGIFTSGTNSGPNPAAEALSRPDTQQLTVVTALDPRSAEAEALVRDVRDAAEPAGTKVYVGGETAALVDSKHAIGSRLPLAALLIGLSTFILLFLFTGSVLQPLRALVLNLVSMSAVLGVMVLIFQDGGLSSVLGFTPMPLDTSMLVLLFCIAFGLSMDYEVFVLSRIKEFHDAGLPNTRAVVEGMARSGRIVSTAAALMAVSFFAFGTASVSFLQLFGIGTGLAILLDATVVRGLLVPAFLRLMGRAAWWSPEPLRRLHISESPAAEPAPEAVPAG